MGIVRLPACLPLGRKAEDGVRVNVELSSSRQEKEGRKAAICETLFLLPEQAGKESFSGNDC